MKVKIIINKVILIVILISILTSPITFAYDNKNNNNNEKSFFQKMADSWKWIFGIKTKESSFASVTGMAATVPTDDAIITATADAYGIPTTLINVIYNPHQSDGKVNGDYWVRITSGDKKITIVATPTGNLGNDIGNPKEAYIKYDSDYFKVTGSSSDIFSTILRYEATITTTDNSFQNNFKTDYIIYNARQASSQQSNTYINVEGSTVYVKKSEDGKFAVEMEGNNIKNIYKLDGATWKKVDIKVGDGSIIIIDDIPTGIKVVDGNKLMLGSIPVTAQYPELTNALKPAKPSTPVLAPTGVQNGWQVTEPEATPYIVLGGYQQPVPGQPKPIEGASRESISDLPSRTVLTAPDGKTYIKIESGEWVIIDEGAKTITYYDSELKKVNQKLDLSTYQGTVSDLDVISREEKGVKKVNVIGKFGGEEHTIQPSGTEGGFRLDDNYFKIISGRAQLVNQPGEISPDGDKYYYGTEEIPLWLAKSIAGDKDLSTISGQKEFKENYEKSRDQYGKGLQPLGNGNYVLGDTLFIPSGEEGRAVDLSNFIVKDDEGNTIVNYRDDIIDNAQNIDTTSTKDHLTYTDSAGNTHELTSEAEGAKTVEKVTDKEGAV